MSNNQLFIPKTIKVGFQNRNDTYTKKLAYVIYFDQKGVLRKEKSWESWRDKRIDPLIFDNVPTEGFVLNKGVGGVRNSYGWNSRNEYIRVYDPRGFEFEISVENLLFILRECDCSKGKGLEGKFVYSWEYTSLVLLPATSQDYIQSQNFTSLQNSSVNAKSLIPGMKYQTKKQNIVTYVGRLYKHAMKCLFNDNDYKYNNYGKSGFFHVFYDGKKFIFPNSLKQLSKQYSDTVVENYAEILDLYKKSCYGSKPINLFLKPFEDYSKEDARYGLSDFSFYDDLKKSFVVYSRKENEVFNQSTRVYEKVPTIVNKCFYSIENDCLIWEKSDIYYQCSKKYNSKDFRFPYLPYYEKFHFEELPVEDCELWVELESGSNFRLGNQIFLSDGSLAEAWQCSTSLD